MKQFINLSPKESQGLDKPLFENAVKLKKDALLIANENKSFSTATSLLILSSEEVIKASLVLLHSEGYNAYKLQDAKKFFRDHKIRHQIAQLMELGVGLGESFDKWKNREYVKFFKPKYNLLNEVIDFLKAGKPVLKSAERVNKLLEFNTLKNNGLYVGYKDKLLIPKMIVSEIEYNNVREIVSRVFNFYKELKKMFEQIPETDAQLKELVKTKEDLRVFINEVMIDFSFQDLNNI